MNSTITWYTTMKPSFLGQLSALPPKEVAQVVEKINMLTSDPRPDAKTKKQLKYLDHKLHRLRSGKYRIFYTFEQPYISILVLDKRDDDTYDEEAVDAEFLGGFDPQLIGTAANQKPSQPNWERIFAGQEPEKRKLPEPITPQLLADLKVPEKYRARLQLIETQEDLLNCPGVPDEILLQLDEVMFGRPVEQLLQQPDFVLSDADDLLRFKEGDLLGFLLKLSPEQEKFVTWGVKASGPTLVKGGPGTGKSTVALYRVRVILDNLQKQGVAQPRILFTTYTNALARSSQQLLLQLLGPARAAFVEVQTADRVVTDILKASGQPAQLARDNQAYQRLLQRAIANAVFSGNSMQKAAQKQAIERLTDSYLLEEIGSVIIGRQLASLEDYLQVARPGRKIAFNTQQRTAVWRVYEAFTELLAQNKLETWNQIRARAAAVIAEGKVSPNYDAVLVDEAQDLDPTVLKLLVGLCKAPNRFFMTADANQSIYGNGFNWSDVHTSLKFQGRTGILKANYRSTREIGEAAHSYLTSDSSLLDGEPIEREYIFNGFMPAVRAVKNPQDEAKLLLRFFKGAARELRLTFGSCAVLCPTENAGRAIATRLSDLGLEATFMPGSELDLARLGIKVITLKSAKGLEFPIVALAGFSESGYSGSVESFPKLPPNLSPEERSEILMRERRTMFVAQTRAMRALLVVVPQANHSPLLTNFDASYWNLTNE